MQESYTAVVVFCARCISIYAATDDLFKFTSN